MEDELEDELVFDFIYVNANFAWKTMLLTINNIIDSFLPGPGESYRAMLMKPGPFMAITFLMVVISMAIQCNSKWLQWLFKKCQLVIADTSIKTLVETVAIPSDENCLSGLTEGIASVYAIKGRRETMEDRYCILQHVEVGESKKLSFFGVYDGHGGQYVVEYLKGNLFTNMVEKIREHADKNKKIQKTDKAEEPDTEECTSSDKSTSFPVSERSLEIHKECVRTIHANIEAFQPDKPCRDLENDNEVGEVKVEELEEIEEVGQSQKKDEAYSAATRKRSLQTSIDTRPKETTELKVDTMYIDSQNNINYTKLLTDQIIEIDNKVVQHCKINTDLSGTTAVIAILDGELLIIGNVGDSRAVMGDSKGATIPLSFDHKPNQLKERRRINDAGGFIAFNGVWRVAGVLATSRAIGDFVLKDPRRLVTAEPDVLTFSLKEHKASFVILATDGLWDVLTNEEAVSFVRSHIDEGDSGAKALVMHAYSKGSQDNITVLVLNMSKLAL